ncbi:oligogalacturonate lyase family protein [Plebeiibacterium sediminum]|uniref:Oligogalacturonate lyase family protein n=1 Tax=Plebeiibacterium sediminum TaxID=2992112 RepID=A0AAE3M2T4_9BACT|nr:oligogalacturonate lyase family protein [Plebeiobacterium sediminum]MCW3785754.1 oligogalacturonate lyase family protein [Plebeiobacterium sediminum]
MKNLCSKSLGLLTVLIVSVLFLLSCRTKDTIPIIETGGQTPMPDQWIDKDTGHKLTKLTRNNSDNRSFYFHNNPFLPTADGKGTLMVYYGNQNEGVSDHYYGGQQVRQLYVLNLQTLESQKLTNNTAPIHGEIVAKKHREVVYQSRDTVYATHVDKGSTRVLYVFPDSLRRTGITTLNADETLLAGVFSVPEKDSILKYHPKKSEFFQLIYEAKLPHTIFTVNTETKELKPVHSDTAWLNHVQFSPTDPEVLMFCHEGPWHKVNRIWTIRMGEKEPMLMHERTMHREIAGHEFFSVDGQTVWFDLQKPRGETFFLAGTSLNSGKEVAYQMERDEWSIHFNISPDQKIFAGDGGNETQVAKAKDGRWIYLFYPDDEMKKLKSEKLVNMKHHDYDLEPNVHFTPDGKSIIFRANFEGMSQIYCVEIKK